MAASELGQRYQRILQMFWDPEPNNDEPNNLPIHLLGEQYGGHATIEACVEDSNDGASVSHDSSRHDANTYPQNNVLLDDTWPKEFLDDFESRHWFTYRNDFPPISRSRDSEATAALTLSVRIRNLREQKGFTSDTGWGCMIRSGQCIVGNALSILRLGRKWRMGLDVEREKEIISLFADDPRAPFSIHMFVKHGAEHCGKHPGEWFGPSATAQCIEALAKRHEHMGLKVFVAADNSQIYEENIDQLARSDGTFKPVLILAGIRLGIDRITPVYREALKGVFTLKQSIGVAGGRPSASYFFIANQGDHFFYLDPHHTRSALPFHKNWLEYDENDLASFHTRRLRRIHVDKMDPSMLLAFLIRDQNDLDDWSNALKALPGRPLLHLEKGSKPSRDLNERSSALDEVEAFDDDEDHDEEIHGDHKTDNTGNDTDPSSTSQDTEIRQHSPGRLLL